MALQVGYDIFYNKCCLIRGDDLHKPEGQHRKYFEGPKAELGAGEMPVK